VRPALKRLHALTAALGKPTSRDEGTLPNPCRDLWIQTPNAARTAASKRPTDATPREEAAVFKGRRGEGMLQQRLGNPAVFTEALAENPQFSLTDVAFESLI